MITREQAREIAERFLRDRGTVPGWDGIGEVASPEEVAAAMTPAMRVLLPTDGRSANCWLARVRGTAGAAIYVSATTGEVEFAGIMQGGPRPHAG